MPPRLVTEVMNAYYMRSPEILQQMLMQHVCRVESLAQALAGGDDAHRAWLEKAIADHLAGRPVQPRQ